MKFEKGKLYGLVGVEEIRIARGGNITAVYDTYGLENVEIDDSFASGVLFDIVDGGYMYEDNDIIACFEYQKDGSLSLSHYEVADADSIVYVDKDSESEGEGDDDDYYDEDDSDGDSDDSDDEYLDDDYEEYSDDDDDSSYGGYVVYNNCPN